MVGPARRAGRLLRLPHLPGEGRGEGISAELSPPDRCPDSRRLAPSPILHSHPRPAPPSGRPGSGCRRYSPSERAPWRQYHPVEVLCCSNQVGEGSVASACHDRRVLSVWQRTKNVRPFGCTYSLNGAPHTGHLILLNSASLQPDEIAFRICSRVFCIIPDLSSFRLATEHGPRTTDSPEHTPQTRRSSAPRSP